MAIEKKEIDGLEVLDVETEEDFREALRIQEKSGILIAADAELCRRMGWPTTDSDGGVKLDDGLPPGVRGDAELDDLSAPGTRGEAHLLAGEA